MTVSGPPWSTFQFPREENLIGSAWVTWSNKLWMRYVYKGWGCGALSHKLAVSPMPNPDVVAVPGEEWMAVTLKGLLKALKNIARSLKITTVGGKMTKEIIECTF